MPKGLVLVVSILFLAALACGGTPTPTRQPLSTAAPDTATKAAPNTATSTASNTPAPTKTVAPNRTPTAIATKPKPTNTSQPPTATKAPVATNTRAPLPTQPAPTQAPESTQAPTIAPVANCDPSYPDVCIPPPPPDLNCNDVPYKNFRVLPPDPHKFDKNKDGIGCEG